MGISGWIYLIVGIGVAVASRYIERLEIFFWVGLALIVIGIFKLIIGFIVRQKESPAERMYSKTPAKKQANFCPRCGSILMPNSRFCSSCGNRVG